MRPLIIFLCVVMCILPACAEMSVFSAPEPTLFVSIPTQTMEPFPTIPISTPSPELPEAPTPPTSTPEPQPSQTTAAALPTQTSAAPTPDLTCLRAENVQVEQRQIVSSLLPKPLQFRVVLPPCYAEWRESHYPVLYLFHGQFSNDDQWDRLGVDETASRMIAAREIPPFLIVLPFDRERASEADESMYDEAIVEELIPFIEGNYRTLPDRAFRAIGGLSRGAGWALHIAMTNPQLFGTLGLHSPAIFWVDTPKIPKWLDGAETQPLPRLYIDLGDHDSPEIVDSTMWFENHLAHRNLAHDFHLFPGYHNEPYWQAHVEVYLRWYAADW